MPSDAFETLNQIKWLVPVVLIVLFWSWESQWPFFHFPGGRWRHGIINLSFGIFNATAIGLLFAGLLSVVTEHTVQRQWGLLNAFAAGPWCRFTLALLLLDGWMYWWHRANHRIPALWRFHRMHHSDPHMDVTSASRFHFGEQVAAATLRLGLVPVFGLDIWHLVIYDSLVIASTQFHHANISIGRADRYLRWLIVTPDMHKVHHSVFQPETDSNYSTVFSIWDRLAGSFRLRPDVRKVRFGLRDFSDARWQTVWGLLRTPFVVPVATIAFNEQKSFQEPLAEAPTSRE